MGQLHLTEKPCELCQEIHTEPMVGAFRVRGGYWCLSETFERQLIDWYGQPSADRPALDVRYQLHEAARWLIVNPRRLKTAGGMPAYLKRWVKRAYEDHIRAWRGESFRQRKQQQIGY